MPARVEYDNGRIALEEAGRPRIDVPAGEPVDVVERLQSLQRKVEYYNQVLNTHLTARFNPNVQGMAISDGVIQVSPRGSSNEDYQLLHEFGHHKQLVLLGFPTTAALVNSFTQDLTTTELGARDWVEKYTMPPFVVPPEDQLTIFGYYQGELRKSLARGIRDIHSDVGVLRNRGNIYLTEEEKASGKNPEEKFLKQFQNELEANIPDYDYSQVKESEPDFVRKIARFRAVSGGAAQLFGDSYNLTGEQYDGDMRKVFGETSLQYRVYTALSQAYQTYFINCTQRTELIDPQQMISALDSPNPLLRARAADFLGEMKDFRAIDSLLYLFIQEEDSFVRWNTAVSLIDLIESNLEEDKSWEAIETLVDQGDYLTRGKVAEFLAQTPENRIPQALKVLERLAVVIYPFQIENLILPENGEARYVKSRICLALAEIGEMQPYAVVDLIRALVLEFHEEDIWDIERSKSPAQGPASVLAEIGRSRQDEVLRICEMLIHGDDLFLIKEYYENRVVIKTLSQLGRIRPSESFKMLKRVYDGKTHGREKEEIYIAAGIIGEEKPDEALAFLKSLQTQKNNSSEQAFFFKALEAIERSKPQEVIPFYRTSVEDSSPITGGNIVARLVKLGVISTEDAVRLLKRYRFSGTDDHGAKPYKIIGSTGSDLALDILRLLSTSPYTEIQAAVVCGLIEFGKKRSDEALDIISNMTGNESLNVLLNLAYHVGELADLKPAKVLAILKRLYNNPDTEVRVGVGYSLRYLANHYPEEVLEMSKSILGAASHSKRTIFREDLSYKTGHVATTLGEVAYYNPSEVFGLLQDMIKGKPKDINKVIDAFGKVGKFMSEQTILLLRQIITSPDLHRRIHAARAVINFASPSQLNQILSDPAIHADVRNILREHLITLQRQ